MQNVFLNNLQKLLQCTKQVPFEKYTLYFLYGNENIFTLTVIL